mmetsp:Transcript_18232/g.47589  ORF Transcript_18232/g.47589 Transcript_18232/m.47589 type:complete len:185 (+) Transcript_18232:97-651(+)
MGKSRGGKYHHKPRERVQRLGARGEGAEEEEESSEEEAPVRQKLGQSSTVGLLPPSDSESEEEGSDGEEKPSKKEEKGGQASTVGKLPPTSDSEGSDSDSDSDGPPMNEYLTAPSQKKKQANAPVERSPEDIRKEMERLQIVKKRREEDRLKRIATEGWDRFQPMSETNRPPGYVPSDHPTSKS